MGCGLTFAAEIGILAIWGINGLAEKGRRLG
jgi:hypothetical protein